MKNINLGFAFMAIISFFMAFFALGYLFFSKNGMDSTWDHHYGPEIVLFLFAFLFIWSVGRLKKR